MFKNYLLGSIAEGIRDHSLFIYIWRVGWEKSYWALELFLPKTKYLEKYYFNVYEFLDQRGTMHSLLI